LPKNGGEIFVTNVKKICRETDLYTLPGATEEERQFLEKMYNDLYNPVLVFLGKRSYGLYLFHMLANSFADIAARKAWIPSGNLFYFLFSLAITIIFAILSYKFIETPFLKLKKKYEVIASRPI
jgi:peptidoglycan/LPS O-acetylase OafA/YrhL